MIDRHRKSNKHKMERGAIVIYSSTEHLNSMQVLATFIAKHHPSIPITLLSFADNAAAAAVSAVPSITYRRVPTATLPPESITDPVEIFFEIPRLNNPSLRDALEEISQKTRIRAFVMDFFCNSAFEVTASLNIPTYYYISSGSLGACFLLYLPTMVENISTDIGVLHEFLEFPGSPSIYSSDLPSDTHFRGRNVYNHIMGLAKNMRKSCGIIANGFDAIEYRAKEAVANGLSVPNGPSPPLYLIGPLVAAGSGGGGDHECMRWLDKQPSKSVIFLCFGRRGFLSGEQLRETAVALEKSGYRFLWSVRNPPGKNSLELDEGFLERTKDRGFVEKSWVPQKEVLSHDAVAGFVTHCGRSSVLEAVVNGVPMIGWPMYSEQRMNRVFLVEESQVALPLEEEADGFVTAVELEKRLRELMESKIGRDMRRRAAELKASGAAAVRENGSSVVALSKFIDAITHES